ncbi:MAG: type II toxin-antitoxin system MqsA family antitoxin, partial [Candidatus Parabeggiatoa sp.]|nr:type II toxin-antitoxin system MqsA family antitoxin [Candidatus Parabeggiatoa sp.]
MTPEKILCPVCEKGEIIFKKGPSSFCYKGHDFTLEDLEYCECLACQYEIILPEQSTRNEARIRDEHRKIDGLLTRAEISELRKRLKITQNQAAQIFGERVNAFSKYESGEATQNQAMD